MIKILNYLLEVGGAVVVVVCVILKSFQLKFSILSWSIVRSTMYHQSCAAPASR